MQKTDAQRVYSIDLLRFICALSVVFHHYTCCLGIFSDPSTLSGTLRYSGRLGLNVLFMISGFVISLSTDGRTWRQFVISRVCRLYPAFWCCCTITFLYASVFFASQQGSFVRTVPEFLVNATLLPQFLRVRFLDEVYWTLEVEIIFYLFIFVLLYFSSFRRIKAVLFVWAAISVLNLVLRNRVLQLAFITDHSHCFILGTVYYLALKEGWDMRKAALAGSMFALLVFYTIKTTHDPPFFCPPGPPVAMIAVVNVVFVVMSFGRLKMRRSNVLPLLGDITYPLYLLHNVVGLLLLRALPWPKPVRLLVVSAGMISAAFVIARFIEKPARKWLKPRLERFFDVVPAIWGVRPEYPQREA